MQRHLSGATLAGALLLRRPHDDGHERPRGKDDDPAVRDALMRNAKGFEAGKEEAHRR